MHTPINNIKLQFACSENWDKMDNHEQEKFCNSCNKKVYDFTNKSQAHFDAIVATNKEQTICGQFNNNQLKRNYVIAQSTSIAIVSSILFIGHYLMFQKRLLGAIKLTGIVAMPNLKQDIQPNNDKIYNTQNAFSLGALAAVPDVSVGTLSVANKIQKYINTIANKTHKNYDGIYKLQLNINAKGKLVYVKLLKGKKNGFLKMKPQLFKMQYEKQSTYLKYRAVIMSIEI
jgi:hypothetical protein